MCWQNLSMNPGISPAFFEKYISKINLKTLSINKNISEDFFQKNNLERFNSFQNYSVGC